MSSATNPAAQVILCANPAQTARLFPDFQVYGYDADRQQLRGRNVVVIGDGELFDALTGIAATTTLIMPNGDTAPDWDISSEDWTPAQAIAWCKAHVVVDPLAQQNAAPLDAGSALSVSADNSTPDQRPPVPELEPSGGAAPAIASDGFSDDSHLWEEPLPGSITPPVKTPGRGIDWHNLAPQTPPERQWAIKGWLGYGHITMLVGAGGIGKTLLAQQMLSHLSLCAPGDQFIDTLPAPVPCVMWACEDDHDELWRRQLHIATSLNAGLEAFTDNLHIFPRQGMENSMFVQENGKLMWTPLIAQLTEQVNDLKAKVVCLDNSGQLYGANENDRHAVTSFLNGLSGALPGCAILLLSHPSRGTGSEYSGSSAWENTARSRLYLGLKLPDEKQDEERPDINVRFLSRRKANYSPQDYRRFTYDRGVLIPDVVESESSLFSHLRNKKTVTVLIDAARELAAKSVRVTDGPTSPDYLPRKILDFKLGQGCNKAELRDAMNAAILDGTLTRVVVGKYANRMPMYALVVTA